jgi:hypothetical protein
MKRRDFSKVGATAAFKRVNWAIGLAVALSACGGGGGAGSDSAADEAAATDVLSLAAQAMRAKNRNTTTQPAPTDPVATEPPPVTTEPAPAPAPSTNLVSNPGFESALTGWSNWGNSLAVTGQSVSGSYSLRVGTAAGGVGQYVAGASAGTSYRLTGQAKMSLAGETVYLGVKFLDSTGRTLLEKSAPIVSTAFATFTVDAVAPAGFANALVYVWKNAGSGYAYVDDLVLAPVSAAPAPAPTEPAPAPAPTEPAPAPAPTEPAPAPGSTTIPLATWPGFLLQTGFDQDAYWGEDGVWGAGALTRGTYTGMTGTKYEQYTGISPNIGPNGEVAFRAAWKWPTGTTEVKSYPSVISGRKPGYYSTWTKPGGHTVKLLNGTNSATYPSGATPGTFFPLQLPIASLKSSFSYKHVATPTGRGHLTYDIWLQGTPDQITGFGAPPITHEIMIPLDYWGNYGKHGYRNPGWYDHDVTIDGKLFHVYVAKGADGGVRADFFGGWKFIVFEPDQPIAPGTLDLAKFINYVATRKDALGTSWATGREYAVSVELGVEPVEGTGDVQISNYRVWK